MTIWRGGEVGRRGGGVGDGKDRGEGGWGMEKIGGLSARKPCLCMSTPPVHGFSQIFSYYIVSMLALYVVLSQMSNNNITNSQPIDTEKV